MLAILMSIRPQHLVDILNGKKTIELRKRFPSDFRGWVYLYCTKGKPYLADFGDNEYPYKNGGYEWDFDLSNIEKHDAKVLNGKVVCRFWVDNVEICPNIDDDSCDGTYYLPEGHCLTEKYIIHEYAPYGEDLFAIHISKLEIFGKPKELGKFYYYKKRLIDCGMDCPPYFDEVKTQVRKAPQSYMYVEVK